MAFEEPGEEAEAAAEAEALEEETWQPAAPEPVVAPPAPEGFGVAEEPPAQATVEQPDAGVEAVVFEPPARRQAQRPVIDHRQPAPAEVERKTETRPLVSDRPEETKKRSPARRVLRFLLVLWLLAFAVLFTGSGVWAALRGDWRDVVYVVAAFIIVAFIFVEDRRRKRAKRMAAAPETPADGETAQPAAHEPGAASSEPATVEEARLKRRFPTRSLLGGLVIICGILLFFLVPQNGDSEKVDEYNRLVTQVTALRDETDALEGELNGLFESGVLEPLITWPAGEAVLGDPGPEEIAALQPVLKDASVLVAEKNEDLARLAALWDEMARLDTGEARTTYCGQQKTLEELDGQMGVLIGQYFATLEAACGRAPLSQAEANELEREISAVLARHSKLRMRFDELLRESQQYYSENF